ncbi:MAG: low molecular weight phosphotyrosine protein phosphatase [Anaeroplasmataceae bacterium]|nr:low molecular weight phosphotyrosine protein phosphatase [Anaeroplasmataceae bacterium]
MIKVLFVCHGNICRSPMAEFLFKRMVEEKGVEKKFYIESAATSSEEIGNPVHYGTKKILNSLGIDCSSKTARRITAKDYTTFDYIIGMDKNNIYNLKKLFPDEEHKIYSLLEFADVHRDIKDPWYTGNFDETYKDIMFGLNSFFQFLVINERD